MDKLTLEQYLLQCLNEEAIEIAKAASKALRFGLDNFHPETGIGNAYKIRIELNDLLSVLDMLYKHTGRNAFRPEPNKTDYEMFEKHQQKLIAFYKQYHDS